MSWFELALITLAGLGAGAINSLVGTGTLITFPTLITLGYPPLTATISNAVGLVAGGVSGTWAYRRELRGQWTRLRWQLPGSLLGAVCGAWLLLHLPERVFNRVVPALLVLALVLVVVGPAIQRLAQRRSGRRTFARAAQSGPAGGVDDRHVRRRGVRGYFSAAQGILLVGVMGVLLPESMQRMNAAKNLLALVVNTVAASAYILVAADRISWVAAGLIAGGSLVGGFLGGHYGRRLSPTALRAVILVVGLIGLWRLLTV